MKYEIFVILLILVIILFVPVSVLYFWSVKILKKRYPKLFRELKDYDYVSTSGLFNTKNYARFIIFGHYRDNIKNNDKRIFDWYRKTLILYIFTFFCFFGFALYFLSI